MSDSVETSRRVGGVFSIVMFLLGIFAFASVIWMAGKLSSLVGMALLVVGTAFFLLGIYKLFTIFISSGKTA